MENRRRRPGSSPACAGSSATKARLEGLQETRSKTGRRPDRAAPLLVVVGDVVGRGGRPASGPATAHCGVAYGPARPNGIALRPRSTGRIGRFASPSAPPFRAPRLPSMRRSSPPAPRMASGDSSGSVHDAGPGRTPRTRTRTATRTRTTASGLRRAPDLRLGEDRVRLVGDSRPARTRTTTRARKTARERTRTATRAAREAPSARQAPRAPPARARCAGRSGGRVDLLAGLEPAGQQLRHPLLQHGDPGVTLAQRRSRPGSASRPHSACDSRRGLPGAEGP